MADCASDPCNPLFLLLGAEVACGSPVILGEAVGEQVASI